MNTDVRVFAASRERTEINQSGKSNSWARLCINHGSRRVARVAYTTWLIGINDLW